MLLASLGFVAVFRFPKPLWLSTRISPDRGRKLLDRLGGRTWRGRDHSGRNPLDRDGKSTRRLRLRAELFAIMRGFHNLGSRHCSRKRSVIQFTGSNGTHPVRCSRARARHGNRNHRPRKHAVQAREHPNNKMGPRPQRERGQRGSRRICQRRRRKNPRKRQPSGGVKDKCFFPQETGCRATRRWKEDTAARKRGREPSSSPGPSPNQRLDPSSGPKPKPSLGAYTSCERAMMAPFLKD